MPRNAPHLIVYPDGLGGDIPTLRTVLDEHFAPAFGGVHLLPPFPSSGDRGFAPTSYYQIDPHFGRWPDITALAENYELTLDLAVNHISRQSKYVVDFVSRKEDSDYADMFIRFSEFWPEGRPTRADLDRIYKRKPEAPYIDIVFADGSRDRLWCTFSEEQIDLDVRAAKTRESLRTFMEVLARHGTSILRLDAVAYVTKKLNTPCFFEEPEIWEVLDFLRGVGDELGMTLLPEVHEHHDYQLKLAEHGYWTYDFALPMLVLHALYRGTGARLKAWLQSAPRRQFTTLDTQDGIGVVDVVDLMSPEEIEQTKEDLFSRGANAKRRYNGREYGNLDIYQINCSYYSALAEDDAAYLLARAIQCFAPGIPQVYYVGLLAGTNDVDLVERSKIGRNINRHNFSVHEIDVALERRVVRKLLSLLQFRAENPAFSVDGEVQILETADHLLHLRRRAGNAVAELQADLRDYRFTIRYGTVAEGAGSGGDGGFAAGDEGPPTALIELTL
jgi:sucrose phosphorylase